MTATRWWVKAFARWIARIKSVQGQLNLFFTAISGVSLASGALRYFGAPTWAIAAILCLLAGSLLVYTWLYSEGGVWNQVSRDQRDMSSDFADPKSRINTEMTARSLGAVMKGRELTPEEREATQSELDDAFRELRDGIDEELLRSENGQQPPKQEA